VTLQAAIEAELPFLRAEAEARMVDTFELRVFTDGWHYDEDLDEDVRDYEVLFTTPGRVKVSNGLAVHDSEVGGRTAAEVTRTLHIPVGSDAVPADAVAVCTAVHATSDPTLLGATLVIGGPAPGSQTTARRLEVTEVLT
jgi:hypothetical protein